MERNRRLDAQNLILTQGTCHVGDGGFAGTPPAAELGNHRVIVQGNFESGIGGTVQTEITAFGSFTNGYHSGRWHKVILRIFGIDTAFDGSSAEFYIFLLIRQRIARSHRDHVTHQIDTGTFLRHRMLYLQTGIHFKEIEVLVFIHHELQCAGTVITDPLASLYGYFQHLLTGFVFHKR